MPWWSWIWIVLMALVTVTGALFDLRDKEPLGRTGVGLGTGVGCVLLALAHHGRIALPEPLWISAVVLIGLLFEAWRDAQPRNRSDVPSVERGLAIAASLALFLPAVFLGVSDAWNAR